MFEKKIKNKWPYFGVILIALISLYVIYMRADICKPLSYKGGDELGVFYIIKTIKDHGWYLFNPQVGGISGGEMYDYMYSDALSFGLIKVISMFSDNIYAIGNIFYFCSYILTGVSSMYVCRKLKISDIIGVVISVLYAFSPYMTYRYGHLWLTPYYLMPLCCLVAIWIVRGETFVDCGKWWKSKRFYQSVMFSFLCAFTGFYYAFFACVIYAIGMVIRIVNSKKEQIKCELYPILYIFTITIGIVINIIPNLVYCLNNGVNVNGELAVRNIGDSEIYGLKLIQLLLPRQSHRISFFQNIALKYSENYPLINENSTASLGIIASLGLIISLIVLFNKKSEKTLSFLNIGLLLVGTVGGIGSIFSLLIYTPMRCYNRICVLIMFISLLCVGFSLMRIEDKISRPFFGIIMAFLLFAGLYDQTISYYPASDQEANLSSTQEFVQLIEDEMDTGSLIFELPYINWPSGGNYRMFAGYLESDTLNWSFGCMQGRNEAKWQNSVANSDAENMLKTLAYNGYTGLYLDTVVYSSKFGEEEKDEIIEELKQYLGEATFISNNGELYFWNMTSFCKNLLGSNADGASRSGKSMKLIYGEGIYAKESDGNETWRWCSKNGTIMINNNSNKMQEITLSFNALTGWEESSNLIIENCEGKNVYSISSMQKLIEVDVVLEPGRNDIIFSCDGKIVDNGDERELMFRISNVKINVK